MNILDRILLTLAVLIVAGTVARVFLSDTQFEHRSYTLHAITWKGVFASPLVVFLYAVWS